jgi:uncharacterized protein
MDEPAITYRYFRLPHQFSNFLSEPRRCDLCGLILRVYDMALSGESDATDGIQYVCDECLSSGKLVERGAWGNAAKMKILRDNFADRYPDLSADEVEALARVRTVEVEQRTPAPMTWQNFFWPIHCGDYCRYVREAGKPDLLALAGDHDAVTFVADCLYDRDHAEANARTIWDNIRPDSPKSITPAYDIGVYLFQCLTCDRYLLLWDAN